MDELPALVCSGWTVTLLMLILHHTTAATDIVRAFTVSSPLIPHTLPWSQMMTSVGLAVILVWAAVQVVQAREY